VPAREETDEGAGVEVVAEEADLAPAELTMAAPTMSSVGGRDHEEQEVRAAKKRTMRKKAKNSARKLRRSMRLKEKERANFELPEDKAARVQKAKFDFEGASQRLRNALSNSYLLSSDGSCTSGGEESLVEIAAACGASEEEQASLSGVTAMPSEMQ
jgi:hypothetical protein